MSLRKILTLSLACATVVYCYNVRAGSYEAVFKAGKKIKGMVKEVEGKNKKETKKKHKEKATDNSKTSEAITVISTKEMEKYTDMDSVFIIDTRFGRWDNGARIPGAESLNGKFTKRDITKKYPDKNAVMVVYCNNSECPLSGSFAKKLKQYGYKNIKHYKEGIEGWEKAGKPVESAKKKRIKKSRL